MQAIQFTIVVELPDFAALVPRDTEQHAPRNAEELVAALNGKENEEFKQFVSDSLYVPVITLSTELVEVANV